MRAAPSRLVCLVVALCCALRAAAAADVAAADVAAQLAANAPADASAEAPQLALRGPFRVGLIESEVDVGLVIDLAAEAPTVQRARTVRVLVWYPTNAGAASEGNYIEQRLQPHAWRPLPNELQRFRIPSRAVRNAPISEQGPFPLIVASHGLLGWAASLNYLTEHLASHGYVAASIEHADDASLGADPLKWALYLRPLDQKRTIETLRAPSFNLSRAIDEQRVALVGYSMGGYGALVVAGASVSDSGGAFAYVPHRALTSYTQGLNAPPHLRAVAAIAPWGAQAAYAAPSPHGLDALRTPLLLIAGDEDDVSGYEDGVLRVHSGALHAPRWLLTYENARHNIGANGAPPGLHLDFGALSYFEEPVWRRSRILDVNKHFITAFFDRVLKDVEQRDAYLQPRVPRARDGVWPGAGLQSSGRAPPPEGARTYWAGFQARWAIGLKLEHQHAAPAQ